MAGKYDQENLEINTTLYAVAKNIKDSANVYIDVFPGDLSIAFSKNRNELDNFLGECFFNTDVKDIPSINWFVKYIYSDAAVDNLVSFENFKIVLGGALINMAIGFKKKEIPSAIIKFYRNALNFYADPEESKSKKALLFLIAKSYLS
jgi:hypothetical protein